MICPTCGKAQLTERPHMHPSARRSGSVRVIGRTGALARRPIGCRRRASPTRGADRMNPERCVKCGSTDLYRGYHAKTTCSDDCRTCHSCDRLGAERSIKSGRAEHFFRSCRGCQYKWMEPAPLVIEEPTE